MEDPTESEAQTDEHKTAIVQSILLGELSAERACEQEGLTTEELTEWVRVYRRATRRAVDDQLAAALSAQGLEVDDFVLSGNLESMAVAELIQTIQYGRKDAHIRIEHDGAHSHIWCMDGDVIDARSGKLVGAPAVYRLLSLREGRLQADFSKVLRTRTIEASTQALMLESAKRFDECRALRDRIGDMSAVYVPSVTSIAAEALLEPAQREVLRAFDGNRAVETIVRESALPDLETLSTIARLLTEGWIAPSASAAEATLPSPAQPAPSSRRSLQLSVLPFAASLRARLSEPVNTRRWVWAGLLAGAAALPLAFAIGFWSARQQASEVVAQEPRQEPRAAAVTLAPGLCGPDMALIQPPAQTDSSAEGEVGGGLKPYCLAAREVTAGEYSACVAIGKCQPAQIDFDPSITPAPAPSGDALGQCNAGRPGHERHPINCVTFRQAEEYCAWRGGRLPTESEWEFAARESAAAAAGGIVELVSGVSEWTSGRIAARNPSAPNDSSSDLYVVLGGGLAPSPSARSARPARLYMNASTQGRSVGFRCAIGVETSAASPHDNR